MSDEELLEAIAELQAEEETEQIGNVLAALFERQIMHMHTGNRLPGYVPAPEIKPLA